MLRLCDSESPLYDNFVLTYPRDFAHDSRIWKKDLDKFAKRFRRQFPKGYFYWKLEPQNRLAPHYHCIGYTGIPDYKYRSFIEWLSQNWFECVGSDNPDHLRAGTQYKSITNNTQVIKYNAKYVSKPVNSEQVKGWQKPGRFWGVVGKQNIVRATTEIYPLYEPQVAKFFRFTKKYLHSLKYKNKYIRGRMLRYSKVMDKFPNALVFLPKEVSNRFLEYIKYNPDSGLSDWLCDGDLIINRYTGEIRETTRIND